MFTNVNFGIFTFVNMEKTLHYLQQYYRFKISGFEGRYLDFQKLETALENFKKEYEITEVGRSYLKVPIKTIRLGTGKKRILAWSQMHGNETTTTRGIIDLLNYFQHYKSHEVVKEILEQCTLLIIPMLNPDGAARYTRENVNKVDLNRDALNMQEEESKVLRACFEAFKPNFCFNLHDQRTIFGAGDTNLPATLSFLAPSMNEERSITEVRRKAMKVICVMNDALQDVIPGQVGRFDDDFNLNCSGDYFQAQKVPTILFECGHFPHDYLRNETRKYFGFSFLNAAYAIASGKFEQQNEEDYFNIPENRKNLRDIILRNALIEGKKVDVALQYSEVIKGGEIEFLPKVETIEEELSFFGHYEIDCKGEEVKKTDKTRLSENDIVEVILLNKEKLSIKSPDIP